MSYDFNVVVGSWGSYNACNARALGSSWLDLSDFSDEDELREELKKQGFELDGIDEELFIQDADGLLAGLPEHANVFEVWRVLEESGIFCDNYLAERFEAVAEVHGWTEAWRRLEDDDLDDVTIWKGSSLEDVAWELAQEYIDRDATDFLSRYFDAKAYARDLSFDGFHEFSGGVVEIL